MATALDIHVDQGSDVRVPIAFIDDFSELLGYSTRTCASLGAFETKALENLRPEKGAQPGDQVANDRGQLFLITAVTESTFTVCEVVGNVGVQIDDEDLSATSVWSSQKVQERIGSPVDFVKIFESELDSSEK